MTKDPKKDATVTVSGGSWMAIKNHRYFYRCKDCGALMRSAAGPGWAHGERGWVHTECAAEANGGATEIAADASVAVPFRRK